MSELNKTPSGNRIHICILGRRNSGKSSLINALTNQNTALVSDVPGTTTDPVYKAMELNGIGPCVFVDTAGFDDEGSLGNMRVAKTEEAVKKCHMVFMVFGNQGLQLEEQWIEKLKQDNVPVILVFNERQGNAEAIEKRKLEIEEYFKSQCIVVNASTSANVSSLYKIIGENLPEDFETRSITEGVVSQGDRVLLVMPQDIQAPKGRLILPQVQTIRDLLDKKCVVTSTTVDTLDKALETFLCPPDVIITDSQAFKAVYEKKPEKSKLTSFSILFAAHKGDLSYYIESVKKIEFLNAQSRILIAEACTHAPKEEDIGRVKIPNMLRKRISPEINIDFVRGTDFPRNLSQYDLIIHCGGCMFNRKYIMNRVNEAKNQGVPMTNYGVVMAYISGILDKVSM
ncbi:[FeFe] hydrogenase H-cluster maturation GTPase HydF [Hathewaya proteolytica DSM 3090]|uniref:[FeFe] hydrogenase H-cluster maturation GTPase HydF n=1 Tax=Hathewaya proteolytica DSM 3090 TaxID=1121331 RepID=A0A1M6K3M7_9CLOT|nr:[FeFe] hydrogenase H-cluster maturation GTPase HydF [Hathewaya proteolytica]SHJ53583.1 [FeFe] hydrogenase H-cluster maturation GTPase HydF [Hathewaya proteolytica DSM 3090]